MESLSLLHPFTGPCPWVTPRRPPPHPRVRSARLAHGLLVSMRSFQPPTGHGLKTPPQQYQYPLIWNNPPRQRASVRPQAPAFLRTTLVRVCSRVSQFKLTPRSRAMALSGPGAQVRALRAGEGGARGATPSVGRVARVRLCGHVDRGGGRGRECCCEVPAWPCRGGGGRPAGAHLRALGAVRQYGAGGYRICELVGFFTGGAGSSAKG
jgi:hypothetical protein